MPDQQPSNAPDGPPHDLNSPSPAAALADTPGDHPGGGGLGGQSAAEAAPRRSGATAPNSPPDPKLAADPDRADADAQSESADRAAAAPAAPVHPGSN